MLPGVSTGGFGDLAVLYANPARLDPLGLNISDLDGDGDLDLVVGYSLSQVVTLLENDGAGSFISVPSSD